MMQSLMVFFLFFFAVVVFCYLQPGFRAFTCLWTRLPWPAWLRSKSCKWSWRSWTNDWDWRTEARSSGTSSVSHAAKWASAAKQQVDKCSAFPPPGGWIADGICCCHNRHPNRWSSQFWAKKRKKKQTDMMGFCFLISSQWVLRVFLLISEELIRRKHK